jgi:hypothetical protein
MVVANAPRKRPLASRRTRCSTDKPDERTRGGKEAALNPGSIECPEAVDLNELLPKRTRRMIRLFEYR